MKGIGIVGNVNLLQNSNENTVNLMQLLRQY